LSVLVFSLAWNHGIDPLQAGKVNHFCYSCFPPDLVQSRLQYFMISNLLAVSPPLAMVNLGGLSALSAAV
jgi:hypothetical protein